MIHLLVRAQYHASVSTLSSKLLFFWKAPLELPRELKEDIVNWQHVTRSVKSLLPNTWPASLVLKLFFLIHGWRMWAAWVVNVSRHPAMHRPQQQQQKFVSLINCSLISSWLYWSTKNWGLPLWPLQPCSDDNQLMIFKCSGRVRCLGSRGRREGNS